MPSSTSNSNSGLSERPGFVRQTASDRPGVAQPVPERDIPLRPWGPMLLVAVIIATLLLTGWELYWRAYGAEPSYRNSNGQWADQRRRIDQGEGGKTVLLGSSRVLFDMQLPVWQRVTGERPIQLAIEGTSPVPMLEDLAADNNFTGRLVVGVAPDLFFTGFSFRGDVVPYYHKQSPSQRTGNWLSQTFIEPYFAFYDPDFGLATVLKRQAWPARPGLVVSKSVRKLRVSDIDRNTQMWHKVEADPEYRALAQSIWAQHFSGPRPPNMDTPAKMQNVVNEQISKAAKAVQILHARGVKVVFIRLPSADAYYAFEQKAFPRATTWDVLLQRTNTPGIHFEDYPQLQGYTLPEWSHTSASEGKRLTAAIAPLVEAQFDAITKVGK